MHVRETVTAAVVAETVGALVAGLAAVVVRLVTGDWPDGTAWSSVPVMAATGVAVDHYRKGPPHRGRGALAGLLTLGAASPGLMAVTGLWLPGDEGLDGALAVVLAIPVAAAVFAAAAGPPPRA
ncbi:hypothetical protein GCM10009639_14190 [Kitasatospora putterlickiae]|uniref:Uncharacterized protein n=1 Tax=Kitasatospora putterlickiae TaxID=221725 RepID=A0ABP4IHA3_9ACTN